ncbi:unnamed protein product [Leptosia nina]|uniref:Uncharacterized protein n=1 Tax=Leptosia nina TaxID=320188 RepID=A0AAV1J3I7_9NEOP
MKSVDTSRPSGSTLSLQTRTCNSAPNLRRRKYGLRKSVPAAIVLWAFHKIPAKEGLTAQRLISFLKKHYKMDYSTKGSKSLTTILRCAVEFGLLHKRGNRYFLTHSES